MVPLGFDAERVAHAYGRDREASRREPRLADVHVLAALEPNLGVAHATAVLADAGAVRLHGEAPVLLGFDDRRLRFLRIGLPVRPEVAGIEHVVFARRERAMAQPAGVH